MLLLVAASLLMTGCQPVDTLSPLYTDKDVIFDSALLGDWVSPDPTEKGITRFTELTEFGSKLPAYKIILIDPDGGGAEFHAHLVNLGGQHFLDAVPQNWEANSDSYVLHVAQSKDRLSVEPRLLRLGTAAYMEFTGQKGGTLQSRLRPAHWFVKVTVDGNKIRFDYADDEKVAKAVAAGDLRISHSLLGEGKSKDIVITAGTEELQKFVLDHIDDQKLFTEHSNEAIHRP